MSHRRPVSRNASDTAADQAEASRLQRVRRLMREEGHRHDLSQNDPDSDSARPPEVALPRSRPSNADPALTGSRSPWEQQFSSGSGSSGPMRSGPATAIAGSAAPHSLPHEELRERQEQSALPRDFRELRRPRSQGTIDSSSQLNRSNARRTHASSPSEQRPASAGHIRREQEVSQGRRQQETEQGRRVQEGDHSRQMHEVSSTAPQEAPDFRISLSGPGLRVAMGDMPPIELPMEGMLAGIDAENAHPLTAMTRRIEMAMQLIRMIEEQTLEERILRAVIEESSQEQLRAALQHSITQEQQRAVPPVKEGVLESLPHVVVTKEDLLDETNAQCAICLEKYTPGARATRILCGHLFCTTCITGWLNSANSCPVCRYELPTERADFEQGRKDRMKGRKAFLKEGDLMMMSGPALQRLLSVLQISTDGRVEKADLLSLLRTNPDVQISLDRSGVCYAEADFAQLDLHAMCALLQRHRLPFPPPKLQKDEKRMRAEVVRLFGVAGLLEPVPSLLQNKRLQIKQATPKVQPPRLPASRSGRSCEVRPESPEVRPPRLPASPSGKECEFRLETPDVQPPSLPGKQYEFRPETPDVQPPSLPASCSGKECDIRPEMLEVQPPHLPASRSGKECEVRPETPKVQATHDDRAKMKKLRSTRRRKPDVKTNGSFAEQMAIQGMRISSTSANPADPMLASMEKHSSSSSSCLLADFPSGPLSEDGLVNASEAEEIFLSAEASTSNRPNSRGCPFPARSSNAARCWEPHKNRVRSLSEKTLRVAGDPQAARSAAQSSEPAEHPSPDGSDISRTPTGFWFKRPHSLTPGQEVHKSAAPSTHAQKGNRLGDALGRPSKFVQRVRRSFKFGGV